MSCSATRYTAPPHRCVECGRPALYWSTARRAYRADRQHDLCEQHARKAIDAFRARRLAARFPPPASLSPANDPLVGPLAA